jgi:uncharacterized protein
MSNKINPVIWFEIPVKDMERAKKFYDAVFDVKLSMLDMGFQKMAQFDMDVNKLGAGGSLVLGDKCIPSHEGVLIYFSVKDIDGTLLKAAKNGGNILQKKMSIGEYGFVGYFEDTEGNRVGLHTAGKM